MARLLLIHGRGRAESGEGQSGEGQSGEWSRLHTVQIAPFRLRMTSMRFSPLAVIDIIPTLS